MNIDEPGDDHIIDEDFHVEFDEKLFHNLLDDDMLHPDIGQGNPNMEASTQGAGWWLLTP